MFDKTITTTELCHLAGLSRVMLHKYRQNPDWKGPPFEKVGEKYVYPLAPALAWVVERNTRSLAEKVETLESKMKETDPAEHNRRVQENLRRLGEASAARYRKE